MLKIAAIFRSQATDDFYA